MNHFDCPYLSRFTSEIVWTSCDRWFLLLVAVIDRTSSILEVDHTDAVKPALPVRFFRKESGVGSSMDHPARPTCPELDSVPPPLPCKRSTCNRSSTMDSTTFPVFAATGSSGTPET